MLPTEIDKALMKLEILENDIRMLKKKEEEFEDLKNKLYDVMYENNVTSYITPNGIKFTKVNPTEERTEVVIDFDTEKFKEENHDLYMKYLTSKDKVIKGRKGYLRMTYTQVDYNEKESE